MAATINSPTLTAQGEPGEPPFPAPEPPELAMLELAAAAAYPTATAIVGGLIETVAECSMSGGGCNAVDFALGGATAGATHRV
ncbi:MAG: hypothetical protein KJ063_04540 [Anaerolineae bacterium]|nr:hypothetical protein [Anaerolineae bacterium]